MLAISKVVSSWKSSTKIILSKMKILKVIGVSIICGLINIRNVNACCCNILPHDDGQICFGKCSFDCNIFGCHCGTIDGYCVHYKEGCDSLCKDPHFKAVKSSELCAARFAHLSMLDTDSDGVISRPEAIEYLVKRNATENTYESNKILMTFGQKFKFIDANKDGYIQPHELDNDL